MAHGALLESESLGPLRASLGVVLGARGMCPVCGGSVVKSEELKQALRLIAKVQTNSKVGPDRGNQLRRAKRELLTVARSGKLDKVRLFRAIEIVAGVLVEIVEDEATRRSE